MKRLLLACLVVLLMHPANASAFTTDKERFHQFIADPDYSNALMEVVSKLLQRNRIVCSEQSSMKRVQPTILQRIKFKKDKKEPYSGRWKEIIYLQGCGFRTQFNFLVTAKPDSLPEIVPLAPGLTEVDAIFQANAMNKAILHAQTTNPECQDVFVAYTEFYKWKNPSLRDKRYHTWLEHWYVDVCGEEKDIILTFIPGELYNQMIINSTLNPNYTPATRKNEENNDEDYDDYDDY